MKRPYLDSVADKWNNEFAFDLTPDIAGGRASYQHRNRWERPAPKPERKKEKKEEP